MMRRVSLALGVLTLAAVWLGPLPALAAHRFSAHMTMHMGVVAVAAPLLALGVVGTRRDPARRFPALFAAIPASVLELVIVWAWHAPSLHLAARSTTAALIAEQGTFLAAGLLVWLSALGGELRPGGGRAAVGVIALLLTSVHMTLLGALLALSPRALYLHRGGLDPAAALADQHLGGAIMLLVGGAAYLGGGVWLSRSLLAATPELRPRSQS